MLYQIKHSCSQFHSLLNISCFRTIQVVHKNLLNACKAKSLQDGRAVKFLNSLELPVMIVPMNVSCTSTPKTSRSRAALDALTVTPGSPSPAPCQSTPTAPPTTPDTGSFSTPKRPRRFVRSYDSLVEMSGIRENC